MNSTSKRPPSSEVEGLVERSILDIGIPPCPAILDRFMTEMNKDEPDNNRLAHIIGTDVSLTAGLIKAANSPFFGLRQRVKSGGEALTMLGLRNSSRVIAGIILRHTFKSMPNMEKFWDASARISQMSGWLAFHLEIRGLRAENAYTYGLFRDCGIPVLLGRYPHYSEVLEKANQDAEQSFTEIEDAAIPTNHVIVGGILAQTWWLPEEICFAIRNHHDLSALGDENSQLPLLSRRLIATAQLAEYLVQQSIGLSYTKEWDKLGNVCLDLLNLNEEQLEELTIEAKAALATFD